MQMLDAVPQHDGETERAVLGAMICEPKARRLACEFLVTQDFYIEAFQQIFETIRDFQGDIDELVIRNALKQRGGLVGDGYGDELAEMVTRANPSCIEAYCQELQRLHRARKLQSAATTAMQSLETNADEGIKSVLESVSDLAPRAYAPHPLDALKAQVEAEIDGTRSALKIPYIDSLSSTQFFLPGTITVICGSAGASKSLFTVELLWRLVVEGIQCAKLDLESAAEFHLRRVIAQMAGDARLTNASYAKAFQDQIRQQISTFQDDLLKLVNSKTMQTPPTAKLMKCMDLLRWISQSADEGKEVLMIDPITMMDSDDRGHLSQLKFIQSARGIVDRKKIRLLLVTHPKNTGGGVDTNIVNENNLSGSRAFAWFVDSVFWLEAHPTQRKTFYSDIDPSQTYTEDYNRTMHILKARLGPGAGKKVAYMMSGDTLRHIERGFL